MDVKVPNSAEAKLSLVGAISHANANESKGQALGCRETDIFVSTVAERHASGGPAPAKGYSVPNLKLLSI